MSSEVYGTMIVGSDTGAEPVTLAPTVNVDLKNVTAIGWGTSIQHVFKEDGTVETTVWK